MIAPTIIIGLGGIGSDICCRVSRQVKDKEQRKRIRFVCIDTDVNDLGHRKEEDSRIITIQTSAPYMVSNYLDTNTNARDNWFPVHNILMGKTPTEGAGQVRAISRLAFEEAVKEGRMTALDKAIEELYFLDGASAPQAVRVIIVSTLAGGTGSGIVLPVALYVRNFLQTRFRKSASVIRGFFLLPEIMFGNKSPEECGSLCCNAYASMRELDAFMRRGDGALEGPKYRELALKLPNPSTGEYVDYKVSPFNFCFLYDKRNTDDLQLKSFDDYKEHAANTIYAQAISGMSSRSNSNEDNAIKPLIKSNGRNRFCGAGSSLLKYPRDSVLRYIAGKWCIQAMDEEWLKIDKDYQVYKMEQKILRKKNPNLKDQTLAEFYMSKIKSAEKGSFEEQIKNMCYVRWMEEGVEKEQCKVDKFTIALRDYIANQIEFDSEVAEASVEYDEQFTKINKLDKDANVKSEYTTMVQRESDYLSASRTAAGNLGRMLGMQLFQDQKDHSDDTSPYRMEYYMKDDEDKFIHPNAVRFFVYSLLDKLNCGLKNADAQIKDCNSNLEAIFDDPKTSKVEDGMDYITVKGIGTKKILIFYLDGKDRKTLIGKIEEHHELTKEVSILMCQKAIYETALKFLQDISEAYEKFYNNFAKYLKDIKNEVGEIERKYVNGEGKATRYVCASEKCLHRMLGEMPFLDDNSAINGKLSASIYQEMKVYAMMAKKPNASLYFLDLFDKHIMGFWENLVENNYASIINMDIITALETEADYESDENLTDEQKTRKAAEVLRQAEHLAAPFVEDTMGEIRHPFTICAYNEKVMGDPESSRRSFVKANLNDAMGGQVDNNVSPYELMVYKAIYNLNAGDLKRFCAPTEPSGQGGTYYTAYIDTIRQLGPNTNKNSVLTPHLDKHWHLTKYMPDLDDFNQSILEKDIYTALAWGILSGKIEQIFVDNPMEGGNILYRPTTRKSGSFIVSNGTVCDELYEVIDALAINPPQVRLILNDKEETMKREKNYRLTLVESKLMNCLNWYNKDEALGDEMDEEDSSLFASVFKFKIKQFVPKQEPSIFDLIYWIKESTPVDDFAEEEIGLILDGIVSMIEEYVKQFVGADEVYKRCFMILTDQFQLFLCNLEDPFVKRPKNRIKDVCVSIIRDQLDERIETMYNVMYTEPMRKLYEAALNEQ